VGEKTKAPTTRLAPGIALSNPGKIPVELKSRWQSGPNLGEDEHRPF